VPRQNGGIRRPWTPDGYGTLQARRRRRVKSTSGFEIKAGRSVNSRWLVD